MHCSARRVSEESGGAKVASPSISFVKNITNKGKLMLKLAQRSSLKERGDFFRQILGFCCECLACGMFGYWFIVIRCREKAGILGFLWRSTPPAMPSLRREAVGVERFIGLIGGRVAGGNTSDHSRPRAQIYLKVSNPYLTIPTKYQNKHSS